MNGYDLHSTVFSRPGRPTIAEASGDTRSDGKASQTRDGANRYDTSTPERRKKALAAARRSGNPADEERLKKQINETNSTIEMMMLQQLARRDNRAKRRGGYRTPPLVVETDKEKEMGEAGGKLPPWLQKDGDDSSGEDSKKRRGKVAESVLNPQIKPRDAVSWNGFEENVMVTRTRPLPDDEEDGGSDPL